MATVIMPLLENPSSNSLGVSMPAHIKTTAPDNNTSPGRMRSLMSARMMRNNMMMAMSRRILSSLRLTGGRGDELTGKLLLIGKTVTYPLTRQLVNPLTKNSFHNKPRIMQILLVISEWLICLSVNHLATCGKGNGVTSGGVPLHGRRHAWIHIGFAFCYEAEFE